MQKQQKSARSEGPRKATGQNAYAILKTEITRIARREIRAETHSLKKAVSTYRSEIAELKRQVQALEKGLKQQRKTASALEAVTATAPNLPATKIRFSPNGLATQRRRLGLSAEACGRLVGTTGQSIYQWEAGKTRPRERNLPAIAALRSMGKKEAVARLAMLT